MMVFIILFVMIQN